jgi:hypothetical protein
MIMIRLAFFKLYEHRRSIDHPTQAKYKHEFVTDRQVMVPFSEMKLLSERPRWTQVMADHLSSMGVPQGRNTSSQILSERYFARVNWLSRPDLPINVSIGDTILHILGTNAETGDTMHQ